MVATSDLTFSFLRPVDLDSGQLVTRARPIDVGDSLGLAEGIIEDGRGRLIAHATSRCFVLRMNIPARAEDLPQLPQPRYGTPDPYQRPAPPPLAAAWGKRPFVAVVAAKRRGELSLAPCSQLLGCSDPTAQEGMAALSLRATPWLTSPAGTVYGGVLTLLADIVSTGAVATTLPSRAICSPLDLKVQFVRPVWPDGRALRATATVAHRGRRFRDRPRRDRRCGRQDGGAGHVVDGGRRGAVVGVAGRCRPSTQRSLAQTELEERRDEMNVLIVTFPLEGMPEAVYSRACQELAPRFAAVPGLISKVWLADPATKTYGGVYSFRDHPALEAYLASELFASLAGLPGLGEVTVHAYGVLEGPTAVTWRASNAAA